MPRAKMTEMIETNAGMQPQNVFKWLLVIGAFLFLMKLLNQ